MATRRTARGREPGAGVTRGELTRRAIHRSAAAIIGEQGSKAASQEQIARRAGISQSTLRHHYPTREALIDGIYGATFEGYRASFEQLLLEPGGTPAERFRRLVEAHLDHIARTDDAYTFESFAHLARNPVSRSRRDDWYIWLLEHYVALLRQMRPELSATHARAIGFAVLTLMLGAWVTLGRTRPNLVGRSAAEARAAVLAGVEALIGVRLRGSTDEGE